MKTTKKDFKIFKEECEKWIKYFGLFSWKMHYTHEYVHNALAFCRCLWDGKLATVTLCSEWPDEDYSINEIKKSAFHEVCEVFISQMNILAQGEAMTKAGHEVIRTLEYRIFEGK